MLIVSVEDCRGLSWTSRLLLFMSPVLLGGRRVRDAVLVYGVEVNWLNRGPDVHVFICFLSCRWRRFLQFLEQDTAIKILNVREPASPTHDQRFSLWCVRERALL